ncbi:MAG: TIGR04255 family protein, partial [Gemmatimonadota bacterium]
KPYTSWDNLFPIFLRSWENYKSFAKPESLVRFGVRYLNHITLPADLIDFDEYLRSGPQLPAGVPPYVSGFLTQVVVTHPEWGVEAAIRQSLEQDVGTGLSTVIIDIDAYDSRVQDQDSDVNATFSTLHEYKNRLFFGSLTEKALELFK